MKKRLVGKIVLAAVSMCAISSPGLAAEVNLALPASGGHYYIGGINYRPTQLVTEWDDVFNGNLWDGAYGVGSKNASNGPSNVYRIWGQEVNLTSLELMTSYRWWNAGWDSGFQTNPTAYYRDNTGSWVSLGTGLNFNPRGEANGRSRQWSSLDVTTDAVKFDILIQGNCSVNEVRALGEEVTPVTLTNLSHKDYLAANGGTADPDGIITGEDPDWAIDGDITTDFKHAASSNATTIDWERDVLINAILVAGGTHNTGDSGTVADVEIFTGGAWHKVENGSAGTSGFEGAFRDGESTFGWGGKKNDSTFDGGELYGTSLRFDEFITASKVRLTNFNSSHGAGQGFIRELIVYGKEVEVTGDFDDDGDVDGADFLRWQLGNTLGMGSPEELALWEDQFGTTNTLVATTSVPEPNSFVLLLAAFACCRPGRRTKRGSSD